MSKRSDLRNVIRACERLGLVYEHGGRHAKLRDPRTGRSIPVSCTPSDCHAHKAVVRDVRRYLGISVLEV